MEKINYTDIGPVKLIRFGQIPGNLEFHFSRHHEIILTSSDIETIKTLLKVPDSTHESEEPHPHSSMYCNADSLEEIGFTKVKSIEKGFSTFRFQNLEVSFRGPDDEYPIVNYCVGNGKVPFPGVTSLKDVRDLWWFLYPQE